MATSSEKAAPQSTDQSLVRAKRRQPAPVDPAFLVTMPKLCELLGLPKKWTRRMTAAGKLPAIRVGNRVLYNCEAVARFLRDDASRTNQFGEYPE